MRKTKIVATLGPASNNEDIIRDMILAGMNVARFNFSHGDYEEHLGRLNMLKKGPRRAGNSSGGASGYQRAGSAAQKI